MLKIFGITTIEVAPANAVIIDLFLKIR